MADYKKLLGFDNPKESITIFKGDTYQYQDWFKKSSARYAENFGWYLPGDEAVPNPLPIGVEPVDLKWQDVSVNNILKSKSDIKRTIGNLTHTPTPSRYQGTIGERKTFTLYLKRAIELETGRMNIFMDDTCNEYIWFNSSRVLEPGQMYTFNGTIKDHRLYNNSQQTILTNCRFPKGV